jgi:hypothetical protein
VPLGTDDQASASDQNRLSRHFRAFRSRRVARTIVSGESLTLDAVETMPDGHLTVRRSTTGHHRV